MGQSIGGDGRPTGEAELYTEFTLWKVIPGARHQETLKRTLGLPIFSVSEYSLYERFMLAI